MPLLCLMLLLGGPACVHEQRKDPSKSDLLFSFQLQRNGGHLNELQMHVAMLDRADYAGLRAALQSSQDSDIVTLCQILAGEHGYSVERASIRLVIRRILDYRSQHREALGRQDPRVDECIGSLLEVPARG